MRLVRLTSLFFAALMALPVGAVDYVRLSPAEFAEDLFKASELAAEGRYVEAIEVLQVLVDDDPNDADALNLLGYSLRKSGDFERAERFYLRALEVEPNHLGANQYLGELYVQRGDLDAAWERLAILDAACAEDCEGRDILAEAIAAAS